jgi:hypothetical protein
MTRLLGLVAVAALAVGLCSGPSAHAAPGAGTTPRPLYLLIGTTPKLPTRTAIVAVDAGLVLKRDSHGRPTQVQLLIVGCMKTTSTHFTMPVPDSAELRQAGREGHGSIGFGISVYSGYFDTGGNVLAGPVAPGHAPLVIRFTIKNPFRSYPIAMSGCRLGVPTPAGR